jgi:serine/threonine protein kinase
MDTLIGNEIGGCRIESKIGQGGMGAVYKAHHLALDITVAVKILAALTVVDKARERFMREARIAAKLRHPNVVGVLNVGTERGIDFIVMEYVEGKNLHDVLAERGAIPRDEAVRIALQVLDALAAAEHNGIVHRDIKPENIMIDPAGNVRLTDMGLARSAGDVNLTQSSVVLGSPLYVAPEQADNPAAADIRADIYSLGCTLFHMLTGSPPFTGDTPIQIILNHTRRPVPRLREVNPAMSEALDNAVYIMMQKSPQERFQKPEQAAAALKSALSIEAPVPTLAVSTPTSQKKRSWAPIWAIALVLCAVIAGAIAAYLLPRQKPTKAAAAMAIQTVIDTIKPDSTRSDFVKPDARQKGKKSEKHSVPKPVIKPVQGPQQPVPEKKSVSPVRDPVLNAVKTGDTEELLRLLNDGGAPNGLTGGSTTPLHEAVRRGSADQVRILTSHGANPNIRDSKGDTPLHYALRDDAQLIAAELLKHGADANLKDHRGRTPLEIAGSISSELESTVKHFGGR